MKTCDFTKGKITRPLLAFTLPLFAGNVFQQLYAMMDAVIVGQTLGTEAFSAVGSTSALSFLVVGFSSGLTAGFAVLTSQYFGAKDEENLRRNAATSMLLSLVTGIVLTAAGVLLVGPLLSLMKTRPELLPDARAYISTAFWGFGATVLYNLSSFLLRAVGNSRVPLIFLVLSSLLNVGLDLLFISVFHMGVAGAGWATVISQALSGAGCMIYMLVKYPELRPRKRHWKWDARFALRHYALGLPMAFLYSIIAIGLIFQQSAVNNLGTAYVAAYTAANKIDNLATQFLVALGTAISTYCGQNFGARELPRIRKGVNAGVLIGLIASAAGCAFSVLLARPLTYVFLADADAQIADLCRYFLIFQGAFYPLLMLIYIYRSALIGMGSSAAALTVGSIELGMRALVCLIFAPKFGYAAVSLSNPVAWLGADIFLVVFYFFHLSRLGKKLRRT